MSAPSRLPIACGWRQCSRAPPRAPLLRAGLGRRSLWRFIVSNGAFCGSERQGFDKQDFGCRSHDCRRAPYGGRLPPKQNRNPLRCDQRRYSPGSTKRRRSPFPGPRKWWRRSKYKSERKRARYCLPFICDGPIVMGSLLSCLPQSRWVLGLVRPLGFCFENWR